MDVKGDEDERENNRESKIIRFCEIPRKLKKEEEKGVEIYKRTIKLNGCERRCRKRE